MIDILFLIWEFFLREISWGRFIESLALLIIIWFKIKPHMKNIEDRLSGLETALKLGFKSGESRFENIEGRLSSLENKNGGPNGANQKTNFA